MNKFRLRVIGALSAIITLIVVTLISISYISFKSESVELTKSILREKNNNVEIELNEKFNGYKQILASIMLTNDDVKGDRLSDTLIQELDDFTEIQKNLEANFYIFNRDGFIYGQEGNLLDFNVKQLNRGYYDAIFNQGKTFFASVPYKSAVTGNNVLGIAYKLTSDVAILASVDAEHILGNISHRKDMFMYSADGTILISPYPQYINKNIADVRPLYKQFNKNNPELTYSAVVDNEDTEFSAFWTSLDINEWAFVTFKRSKEIAARANEDLISSLIVAMVCLVIAIAVMLVIIKRLVLTPVGGAPDDIAAVMEKMAGGDLRRGAGNNGQATGINLSLNNFANKLNDLVKGSLGISENVSSASHELNTVMEDTLKNAQDEQSQMEQISTAISELSSTSLEVCSKAATAEEETRKTQENVANGKHTLEQNINLTNDISTSVTDTAAIVAELREFAIEIGSVTEVINQISEQTNLLALNAAIEAARAGEYGRGFAVVADEVRNLASKTQQSTVTIQNVIEKLQTQSDKANNNMNQNLELIHNSVILADNIKASFEEISTAIESISDINTLVATASQEQHAVTEEISQNTTKVFDLVQLNVSAINQTLQASNELSQLAEMQKSELGYFKI